MDSTGQRLKIFCVYFDSRPVWRSDCVEPIQAGRALTGTDLGMAADDTGDQISAENARYGEMTAWYWVWKNYLPRHPELEYVGFSHYRRFLDFSASADGRTRRTTYSRFRAAFERHYGEEAEKGLVKITVKAFFHVDASPNDSVFCSILSTL